jgi:acylphosphatase
MDRYHLTVHGIVQGVGFRYFVLKSASLYGIYGWVRNKSDNTVEIDAEGSENNMEAFIEAVKNGNRFSEVSRVNIEKIPDLNSYKSFKIIEDDWG